MFYKRLDHLQHPDYEVLCGYNRRNKLRRGFSCLVLGVVYHPPKAADDDML